MARMRRVPMHDPRASIGTASTRADRSACSNPACRTAARERPTTSVIWRLGGARRRPSATKHRSVLRPDQPIQVPERERRLEIAYQAAMPLLAKQFDRRAVIDGSDARVAAARGLIASGVETAEDVNAITRAFRERGIRTPGEKTRR